MKFPKKMLAGKGLSLVGCMLLLTLIASSLQAGEWTRFRGPNGQGKAEDSKPPLRWSGDSGLAWKVKTLYSGTSSPIVVGDQIILTGFSGFQVPGESEGAMPALKLWLYSLDLNSGSKLWETEIQPDLPEQDRIRENHGYASNTPVTDGEKIYAFFGKTGVFAFDLKGKQLWKAKVGSGLSGWGSGASLVLVDDLVIVNASVESESLVALDQETGAEKWRVGGIKESWNTPILVDGSQAPSGAPELAVGMLGKVKAYDPADGAELWSCDNGIQWYIAPSMVSQDGIVWSIGGRSGTAAVAVRAGGRGDVTASKLLWSSTRGSNVSSPIVHEGHIYWAHENLGVIYCAKAMTGELVYEERLPRAGQVYPSPILAGGRIYYVSRGGKTFVVPAEPRYELLAVNDLGVREMFNASPAVVGNRILIRSDRSLYCVGE